MTRCENDDSEPEHSEGCESCGIPWYDHAGIEGTCFLRFAAEQDAEEWRRRYYMIAAINRIDDMHKQN